MLSKLAVAAVLLVAVAGAFADDFTNNCNAQKKICQNGGVCHENVPALGLNAGSKAAWVDPFCICQAPYGGNDCSYTIRECKDSPCANGATCVPADCVANPTNQHMDCFTCTCAHGWTGAPSFQFYSGAVKNGLCDWKMPGMDCTAQNLCANGGTCSDSNTATTLGYTCNCPTGWIGTNQAGSFNVAHNCTAADCTVAEGVCLNGGTCVGRVCSCPTGYGGYRCEIPRFCDNPNACPDGNTCTNTGPGTGTCTAPAFCSTNPCTNGGTCHPSGFPGSNGPYCSCVPPHDGGNSCNSTQYCDSNPCMNGATCHNALSYIGNMGSCSCPTDPITGYPLWGGLQCEKPIVGCAQGPRKVCANGVACNMATGVTNPWLSTCDDSSAGYVQGGVNHFDCGYNSTAVSKCPGVTGTAKGQNADMVCQNGGSCVESADQTGCKCRTGFWGDQCQNYDNPCLNSPCENGGQCYVVSETNGPALDDRFWAWRCSCKWPFYGENCEKQAPLPGADGRAPVVCGDANSPCMNGGTCGPRQYSMNSGGFFNPDPYTGEDVVAEPWACTCPSNAVSGSMYAYAGLQCEIQTEQCTPTTCQNGGICTNSASGVSAVQCQCPCGYAGDRCEFPATNIVAAEVAMNSNNQGGVGYRMEFCSREPCQNGGTCFHPINGNGFGCGCKSGWAGSYCQYRVRSSAAGVVPSLIAVAAAVAAAFALKH